ncbi:MAG TPA: VOC family protein [Patescibacteria group bacterium]|nr:VOC family protein [Patescibacteria group bacterium]
MKSISGLTCYVSDLAQTADFYKELGFRFGNQDENELIIYLNWFSIRFLTKNAADNPGSIEEASANSKGEGIFIGIKVGNADDFYQGLLAKGLKPETEPQAKPSGSKEFVLRDPDGYKLAFFEKK